MGAAQDLYFRLPVGLQNAAISAYGLRLRWLRYGAHQRQLVRQLMESERWSRERLERHQLERLRELVDRAAQIPLYRDKGVTAGMVRSLDDLRTLPTVAKADLQQPVEHVVAPEFQDQRLREIHTGGTTGKPLVVYCTRPVLQANYAFFERFRAWAGIGRFDRTAVFAGRLIVEPERSRPPYWRHNLPNRSLLLSSYHLSPATVPDYVKALRAFRPALIDSYPSSLDLIARHLVASEDNSIRPRAVITSSETLTEASRSRIEQAFGCPVFDHYGAAEMAALITQCSHGTYHINADFGIVELLTPDGRPAKDGERGEIVATGFINPVMPLIRYRTGDLATAAEGGCPCGRPFPVVREVLGRMDDVVVTPDGRRIGRLDPIFKATSGIVETRIVQDRVDAVRLEIVPGPDFSPIDEASLHRELAVRLGPSMAIDVVHVEAIPRAGSGKLRTVLNLLDEGDRSSAP